MPSRSLMVDRYVMAAAVVLTCVLFTAKAADPVNVIKLTALLLCALALCMSAAYRVVRHRVAQVPTGPVPWIVGALLAGLVVSAAVAPVRSTALLGAYGRNSGLLAYVSALLLFVVALRVLRPPHTRVLLGGVVLAGLFTASYGLLQRAGVDAIPWNNPFNPVIAALGNPNFASGYLGIAASTAAGGALWTGWDKGWRVASGATALLSLLAAALSSSVQGPIAAAGGLFVVALAVVLGRPGGRARQVGLAALVVVSLAGTAVLTIGATAKAGPAGAIFADRGSQARVHYWQAAVQMFQDRPAVGVGLDQYGSFWRADRSVDSVNALGGSSFTDAAHSVPLQMVAQGGVILGISYAAFLIMVSVALIRGLVRQAGPDRMLLGAVGGGWAAYQVQSLVSIDQVPLIVLHFTLAGAVVAASGVLRWKELRLPGALAAPQVHPNDVRARRRVAAQAPPRHRAVQAADVALIGAVALVVATAAFFSLHPLRANVAVASGDKTLAAGDGNLALAEYRKATALVPGQPVYWLRQGGLYSQVRQPDLARTAFAQAAARDPFDATALRQLGEISESTGDLPGARRAFDRLAQIDPHNPASLVAVATFELRHSGAARARELLEPAAERLTDAALLAALGDARAVLGDVPAAQAAYEQALSLEPGQPTATAGLEKLRQRNS